MAGATFTVGSTQEEVLDAQGTLTGVQVWESLNEIDRKYQYSTITFTFSTKTVKEYNESTLGDKLNVK